MRRGVINEKYADIIDAIYGGQREIPVDTWITFQDGTKPRIVTTWRWSTCRTTAAADSGGRGA